MQGVDVALWNGGGVSKVDNILVGQMYPPATSLQGCVRSPGSSGCCCSPAWLRPTLGTASSGAGSRGGEPGGRMREDLAQG